MIAARDPAPEPPQKMSDPADLLAAYLDFYRDALLRKLEGLSERQLRTSVLPSGWTPLELLKHLAHVERRWLCWGFAGEQVVDPWGDDGSDGRWHVADDETVEDVTAFFMTQCRRSREIVAGARLTDVAAAGGRFTPPAVRPALSRILFHLLQEYARHVGQLDVVRELIDGAVGE
ncbi:DinB family protein [Actinoallomurus sp. CA-150999]|uniref:DinB family protein n=1 Tax=Actinoallomurus sp. CA-150999 TaxID=3239887 RepID=UPI003D93020C